MWWANWVTTFPQELPPPAPAWEDAKQRRAELRARALRLAAEAVEARLDAYARPARRSAVDVDRDLWARVHQAHARRLLAEREEEW